jgi:UPF0148 protein
LSKASKEIRQMSDVLKQGATLTELACPACASPLFRFKSGELRCVKCDKRVVVVREGENTEKMAGQARLSSLENTILEKIRAVEERIRSEENPDELQRLNTVLAAFLENLQKLRKIQA